MWHFKKMQPLVSFHWVHFRQFFRYISFASHIYRLSPLRYTLSRLPGESILHIEPSFQRYNSGFAAVRQTHLFQIFPQRRPKDHAIVAENTLFVFIPLSFVFFPCVSRIWCSHSYPNVFLFWNCISESQFFIFSTMREVIMWPGQNLKLFMGTLLSFALFLSCTLPQPTPN